MEGKMAKVDVNVVGRKQIIERWGRELESCIAELGGLLGSQQTSESDRVQMRKLIEYARGFLIVFGKLDDEVNELTTRAASGDTLLSLMCESPGEEVLTWRSFILSEVDRLDPDKQEEPPPMESWG
jgi:hypothetical protein